MKTLVRFTQREQDSEHQQSMLKKYLGENLLLLLR